MRIALAPFVMAVVFGSLLLVQPTRVARAGAEGTASAIAPFLNGVMPTDTPAIPGENDEWDLVDAFPQLPDFQDPIHLVQRPGTNTLWLMELRGRMYAFENDESASTRALVLDLGSEVLDQHDSGAFSFAFHPNFGVAGAAGNDEVFVAYKWTPERIDNNRGYMRLSRFQLAANGAELSRSSERVMIQQYDTHNWHSGLALVFGQDGYLYMTVGDEGAANDAYDSAQELDTGLFSGVLRIDVDEDLTRSHAIRRQPRNNSPAPTGWPASFSRGYTIPNDNPFLDASGSILEEFYCVGLRSPHRMSMDPETGAMWIGDVGQGTVEEISIVAKGANFQWPWMEGTRVNQTRPATVIGTEAPPFFDYRSELGRCVIGGHVYRGAEHPLLYGKYIFGDNRSNQVYALDAVTKTTMNLTRSPGNGGQANGITSINADADGELYVLALDGRLTSGARIRKLRNVTLAGDLPPATLSETGAFSNLQTLTPAAGIRPYEVNTPLWSDGAAKRRFLALPNDGTHDKPDERIGFSEAGNWTFPVGTVLIKHFELGARRLETRFMVHGIEGWYGLTYRWRLDGSDADLLPGGYVEDVVHDGESIEWNYPSRSQCMLCHTDASGKVLGARTHQLNRDCTVPGGGTRNQLLLWNDAGMFDDAFDPTRVDAMLQSKSLGDNTATLERRARSYLDSNCAHCHQPGGVRSRWDGRLTSPPRAQVTLDVDPDDDLGIANARVIAPASTTRSVLYQRVNTLDGCCAMPILGRATIDTAAVAILRDWIDSMDASTELSSRDLTQSQIDDMIVAAPFDPIVVSLTAPLRVNEASLSVAVTVSVNVVGHDASDYVVTNGTISAVTGADNAWTLTVVPADAGDVTVHLPSDRCWDSFGNANSTSNTITTHYDPEPTGGDLEPPGPSNPALWIKFNEGASNQATGEGANGLPGTLVGGATWIEGRYGSAVRLDGTGYIDVPPTNALNVSNQLTVAAWIRPERMRDWDGLVTTGGAKSPWAMQLWGTGALRFTANWDAPTGGTGSGSWNSASALMLDEWQHVAVTYDGSKVRFYVNGVLDANEVTTNLTFGQGEPRLVIGAGLPGADEFFKGGIDDVRVFGRALSIGDIQSLIAPTDPPPPDTTPPTVTLTTPLAQVQGAFSVDVLWDEPVTGLSASDFTLVGGTASLSGGGASYQLLVTPQVEGVVTVMLPAATATDLAGNPSNGSNTLTVNYEAGPPPSDDEPTVAPTAAFWMKFNEGTGTSATASGANGEDGALVGATWAAGRFGQSVLLDGSSHVSVPHSAALDLHSRMTISAWVYPERLRDWDALVTRGSYRSPWALQQGPGGALRFTANWASPAGSTGSGSWTSTTGLSLNAWHHVAATYDGSRVRLYIDGREDYVSGAVTLVFGNDTPRFVLGAGLPDVDEYLRGAIDDARVFDVALSLSDIRTLAGLGGTPALQQAILPVDTRVSFQPEGAAAAQGDLVDTGAPFAERNGLLYGWSADLSSQTTQSGVHSEPAYDTSIQPGMATWEIEVANGAYEVRVVTGDPLYESVAGMSIEGTTLWNGVSLEAGQYRTRSVTVHVTDGRLTLRVTKKKTRVALMEVRGQ